MTAAKPISDEARNRILVADGTVESVSTTTDSYKVLTFPEKHFSVGGGSTRDDHWLYWTRYIVDGPATIERVPLSRE